MNDSEKHKLLMEIKQLRQELAVYNQFISFSSWVLWDLERTKVLKDIQVTAITSEFIAFWETHL